jgi:phosphoribosylamine--glycine ligase
MGAYSPAPIVTDEIFQDVMDSVIRPTVDGMAAEGNAHLFSEHILLLALLR